MLFLLIACAAAVYLWHAAPALLLLIGGLGLLWYVVMPLIICLAVAIPLMLIWGYDLLHWLANALPAWRWLTAESLVPDWLSWLSFRHDRIFYGSLVVGTLALLADYALRVH